MGRESLPSIPLPSLFFSSPPLSSLELSALASFPSPLFPAPTVSSCVDCTEQGSVGSSYVSRLGAGHAGLRCGAAEKQFPQSQARVPVDSSQHLCIPTCGCSFQALPCLCVPLSCSPPHPLHSLLFQPPTPLPCPPIPFPPFFYTLPLHFLTSFQPHLCKHSQSSIEVFSRELWEEALRRGRLPNTEFPVHG